jgi:transcriptional regulator with XRE-family HTH domain
MDLALDAGVSTRHVSFIETGRSRPSATMVLQLAEQLEVPLRERNALLLAAGHAPSFAERSLDAPEMTAVREAIDLVLGGHDPYPAAAVDRGWNLVAGNGGLGLLTAGVSAELLRPPVNVIRLSLHPSGVAPRILNLGQWRSHLLDRLGREIAATGDAGLQALVDEVSQYPAPADDGTHGSSEVVVPLRIRTDLGDLEFFSTVTTFGTAVDITVAELAIESFFPADELTRDAVARHAARQQPAPNVPPGAL